MTLNDNRAVVRRAVEEVWNKGDLSLVPVVYAPDFVSHQHSHPNMGDVRGTAALIAFLREFREAFPDFHDTIDDQVSEGEKVVTRVTSSGTHRGTFMGLQPTDQQVSWDGDKH
jgi:steroid delta-isomerase-like uncharacterized protein